MQAPSVSRRPCAPSASGTRSRQRATSEAPGQSATLSCDGRCRSLTRSVPSACRSRRGAALPEPPAPYIHGERCRTCARTVTPGMSTWAMNSFACNPILHVAAIAIENTRVARKWRRNCGVRDLFEYPLRHDDELAFATSVMSTRKRSCRKISSRISSRGDDDRKLGDVSSACPSRATSAVEFDRFADAEGSIVAQSQNIFSAVHPRLGRSASLDRASCRAREDACSSRCGFSCAIKSA
jgi:hypothetical protein